MSEWQPIETAPRDGTYILVLFDGEPHVVRWVGPADYLPRWQWALRYENNGSFNGELATHWIPIPELPVNTECPANGRIGPPPHEGLL